MSIREIHFIVNKLDIIIFIFNIKNILETMEIFLTFNTKKNNHISYYVNTCSCNLLF